MSPGLKWAILDCCEGSERCKKGEKTGENGRRKVGLWEGLADFLEGSLVGDGEAFAAVSRVAATSLRLGDVGAVDPG